jgi:hypothetical protein
LKFELMTMFYNEALLAPYFFKHYDWCDRIHLFLDQDTTDSTLAVAEKAKNVEIIEFRFPDMLDELIKVQAFNNKYKVLDSDWVGVVDADEFIFDNNLNPDIRNHLSLCGPEKVVVYSRLANVYRHILEADLDIDIPVPLQRRHGVQNFRYVKPDLVRGRQDLHWECGHHVLGIRGLQIYNDCDCPAPYFVEAREPLLGAHWTMADVDIAKTRRLQVRSRQSQENKRHGWTNHNYDITAAEIEEECRKHNRDPQLF